jgi:hypothetical protein
MQTVDSAYAYVVVIKRSFLSLPFQSATFNGASKWMFSNQTPRSHGLGAGGRERLGETQEGTGWTERHFDLSQIKGLGVGRDNSSSTTDR